MRDVGQLVERYVAVWNERDAGRRRRAIAELWAEDGAHYTNSAEARGHDAIAARIAGAHQRLVQNGGYIFKPIDNVDSHHDTVKFNWLMIPAAGGDVSAVGFDFFVLGKDGRIQADYQFIEP